MPDGYGCSISCLLTRKRQQPLAVGFPTKCENKIGDGTNSIKPLHLLSDSPKLEEKRKGEQLKPGSFAVLRDGQWQSGAQVAIKKDKEWLKGTLIHVAGNKVLVLGFGSKIEAYDKADVRIIPFKEKIKVGDKVWATWVNEYRPGYVVTAVDNLTGHVYVKREGRSSVESKSFADVTKVLEE